MTEIVQTVDYHKASPEIKKQIYDLLQVVWPSDSIVAHKKELNVQSFYLVIDKRIVSYCGVIYLTTVIDSVEYKIGGLSSVATLPQYRNRGFGSQIVKIATAWMEERLDFGIFTCSDEMGDFYRRCGNWHPGDNVILYTDTVSSEKLDLLVQMRLFSNKAKDNEQKIMNTSIYLDFPAGQFI